MLVLEPRARKWTRAEYYRMGDLGWFRGQRVELIEGTIVQMPPQKNFHVIGINLVEEALRAAFGPGFWVRIQAPLHLLRRSAPEPDAAVVPGKSRDYKENPSQALLVVEVSDTTLAFDRGLKAALYARAGIEDYWVVDLVHGRLVVHRRPVRRRAPGEGPGYRFADVTIHSPGESVAPLAAPKSRVAVSDLLP
jgi:Uma2 family endonuclease